MVTIELGEVAAHDEHAIPELSGRTRRGLLVALVALALLFGVTGSTRAFPGLSSPLWTGEVSLVGFSLGTHSLYFAETNGHVVLARDLVTGKTRWRLEIPDLPLGSFDLGGGVAGVLTHTPLPGGVDQARLSFVREATGEVFAHTSGSLVGRSTRGDRLIVVQQRQFGTADCPQWGDNCADVITYDTASGQVVGRLTLPPHTAFVTSYVDNRVEAFATATEDGEATIYDASTGALLDHIQLAVSGTSVMIMPGLLVSAHREADDSVRVTAYRRAPLTRAWSTVLPVDGPQDYPTWWLAGDDCGQSICLRANSQTVLLDQATGAVRTSFQGEILGTVGRGALVGFEIHEPGPPVPHPLMILDPVSGAVTSTIDNARAVPWSGSGDRALLAQETLDRTTFLLVRPDGHVEPLGSVTGAGLNCEALDTVLACSDPGGDLRVWRFLRR